MAASLAVAACTRKYPCQVRTTGGLVSVATGPHADIGSMPDCSPKRSLRPPTAASPSSPSCAPRGGRRRSVWSAAVTQGEAAIVGRIRQKYGMVTLITLGSSSDGLRQSPGGPQPERGDKRGVRRERGRCWCAHEPTVSLRDHVQSPGQELAAGCHRAAPLLAAVGPTGVAGASFASFYAGLGSRLPVFTALVVGTALAVWLRVVSWHPVVRVTIAVVATIAVSATLSTRLSRTAHPSLSGRRGMPSSPPCRVSRMLSVGLPAEPTLVCSFCRVVGPSSPPFPPASSPSDRGHGCLPPCPLPALPARPARDRDRAGATIWLALVFLVLSLLLALVQTEADGREPGHRPWITT